LHIGSLTTHAEVADSDVVAQYAALLAQAAKVIGDVQVRNMGTIGGSLAHNDPGADYPAAILALEATVTVQGPNGQRHIAATEFLKDMYETALEPGAGKARMSNFSIPLPAMQWSVSPFWQRPMVVWYRTFALHTTALPVVPSGIRLRKMR